MAFTLVILVLGLKYFTSNYLYNQKIAQNIFIEDVDVSNLSKKEAIDILNAKYPKKSLKLSYGENNYTIKPEDVELVYYTEEAVDNAYNFTRENSYFKNLLSYINAKFGGKDYSIRASFNEDAMDNIIKTMSKEINRDFTNASVTVSSSDVEISSSETGLKVNEEDTKNAIIKHYNEKSYEKIDIEVDVIQPEIKTSDLSDIDSILGSFSTRFNAGLYGRTYNIALALSRCSGKLLMPGETFSYNDSTGPRYLSNGFKNASIILKGEYEDAPGGGVCQGSTTLFNAALLSGLEITEVHNHSKTSTYVSRGRDAMVNDGGSDFKFTNNFKHPVYVSCYVSGSTAYAAIYGSSKDKTGVSINTKHFTYSGRPAATTYRTLTKDGKSETAKIYTAVYQE